MNLPENLKQLAQEMLDQGPSYPKLEYYQKILLEGYLEGQKSLSPKEVSAEPSDSNP